MTFLAIDAGNTNTVLGLFRGRRLARTWRVASNPSDIRRLASEIHRAEAVMVSSVVPALKPLFHWLSRRVSGQPARFVSPELKSPLKVRVKNPREVGQDRLVNAAAAFERWKCGLIVVDLGTATTCDVVTPKGEYIGGTISPGIGIANEALYDRTALLPFIPVSRPDRVIGRNTAEAIRSGVFYGYVGLIDGLVERIKKDLRFPVKVVATGGLSALVGRHARTIESFDPDLTLKGLRLIWDWNRR